MKKRLINLTVMSGLLLILAHTALSMPFRIDRDHYHPVPVLNELDTVRTDLAVIPHLYTVDLAFDFEESTFQGHVYIDLQNCTGTDLDTIVLDAASNTLTIESVTRTSDGQSLDFTHANDRLVISYAYGIWSDLEIRIAFSGTAGTVDGPFGDMGLWMHTNTRRAYTFFFPDGAHAVFPVFDDPACKAPITWELIVPADLDAVANGYLYSEDQVGGMAHYVWVEENPVCTSEMGFCIADYAVITAQTDPFPIRYYVYPEDSTIAAFDLARVPEAVGVFEEAFGRDYPFSELKIVECGVFGGNGGQEHQTMVSLGHNMITGNRAYESIIVHEVSHQWFADLLTPVDWDHFWLNEGYAVYSEALWAEHLGDFSDYLSAIHSDRNEYMSWLNAGNDQALVNSDYYTTMNSPLPYERGAVMHHMLRMRYDMETFTEVTAAYISAFEDEYVSTEDLRETWIEITEDETLPRWFDEWIWRGECPLIHWTTNEDGTVLYTAQILDDASSPDHGQYYYSLDLFYGDENVQQRVNWPNNQPTFAWTLADWSPTEPENPRLMPRDEALVRSVHRDDITAPDLQFRIRLADESDRPDNVLQAGETATLQVYATNMGLPLTNATWQLAQNPESITFQPSAGNVDDLSFLQPETLILEIEVSNSGPEEPAYAGANLAIAAEDYTSNWSFRIATGRPEVLLIEDGVDGAIDTLIQVLEPAGIVWGTPNVDLDQLPSDMFLTEAVMIEVDGRYSEFLFTTADTALRRWATMEGSTCISGEFVNLIYADASPEWLGGIAGEWLSQVSGTAFVGLENDEIADGRLVVGYNMSGISDCSACCGGPNHFLTPTGTAVAAHGQYAGRVVGYGMPLHKLHNSTPATMTRDELILRTALYLLGRDTFVEGEQVATLPGDFAAEVYPVPFNSQFTIKVYLPVTGPLDITMFNILGQQVKSFGAKNLTAGRHLLTYDASDLASGLYLVRVKSGEHSIILKNTLIK